MASLDVLVFPTLWYECSPLIIQEAFAVQLPVVASRIGAVEESIRDGHDGILFPPGDADGLYETLLALYRDPARVRSLREGIPAVRRISDHLDDVMHAYSAVLGQPVNN
jgi:glycosyltransferase involved in cell wall biosynthesis